MPSQGEASSPATPWFRRDPQLLQNAIDRLTKYQYMADFGTCAVDWPLQREWEQDILAGRVPEL